MLNKFLLSLVIIFVVGWWAEENVDFAPFKQKCMDVMSQEKTVKTINSSRELRQEEMDDITSGKYNRSFR